MPQPADKPELIIKGVAAVQGVAQGPAFVFFRDAPKVPNYPVAAAALEGEKLRFERALLATREELSALRQSIAERLGESEASIFDAHLLVLEDPALIGDTLKTLGETTRNIEHCFFQVASRYIKFFAEAHDPYLNGRMGDIRDVARRVLHHLAGFSVRTLASVSDKRVIVAEELTPSDTASFEAGNALAIVTDGGSLTSHAVIMARALRIPAVVGLLEATKKISYGDEVLVDGHDGVVYVNPSVDTLYRYGNIAKERLQLRSRIRAEAGLDDVTAGGAPFKLSANVNGAEDMPAAHENHARGVGLYRTESIFLKNTDVIPDEETQFRHCRELLEAAAPERVIVRTLDIGGDKPFGALFSDAAAEANPFMGFRAIRFCLENKGVFRVQLRAILRASAFGSAKIMFPMISSLEELLDAKAFLQKVASELRAEGIPFDEHIPVGTMIEIPSAAVIAATLAEHCDFLSVGTNDLVQYMLAVDRGNGRIAHLYEPCNPAVLIVLRDIIRAGKEKKKKVSVCGELAGFPAFAPLLIALGADSLSMTPAAIPEIRYILRRSKREDLDNLVERVYASRSPKETDTLLRDFANARLR
ncbi:MAG: phosphoenolpyruvate--protein phosphotransferase [Puniceicoccales bacterium]|nr:phosphoenolpyruvate--protein phosphotransferase [Puniceicoccales bacterium]